MPWVMGSDNWGCCRPVTKQTICGRSADSKIMPMTEKYLLVTCNLLLLKDCYFQEFKAMVN
jgi:hypothetical protein